MKPMRVAKSRSFSLLAAVLIASLGAAGCKKKGADQGQGGGAAGGGSAAAPADVYKVFPKDSELVIGMSFAALRSSALWKQFGDKWSKDMEGEIAEFKTKCNIDPTARLSNVVIGGNPQNQKMLVAVTGLSRGEVKSCLTKLAAENAQQYALKEEGNISETKVKGETMYIGWLNDSTMVLVPDKKDDKTLLSERLTGKDGLDGNAAFMGIIKGLNTSSAVWFAAVPAAGSPLGAGMTMATGGAGPAPKSIFGTVSLQEGLKVDASIRYGKPEEAKQFQDQINAMLMMFKSQPEIGKYVQKLSLNAAGNDVVIKMALTQQELDELIQKAKASPIMGGGAPAGGPPAGMPPAGMPPAGAPPAGAPQ
jgi:hypothetical protein